MTAKIKIASFALMLVLSAMLFAHADRPEKFRSRHTDVSPQMIMGWLTDLCKIAGYGINSGIQTQPKLDQAANYILKNLHRLGLRQAKLEPITANSPYPKAFEITVNVPGEGSRAITCFPLQWTAGTPPGGITGGLAYVGDGSASNFELVDVKGKIALIDEKMIRGYSPTARSNGAVVAAQKRGAAAIIRANLQLDSPQFQKNDPVTPPDIFPIPVFSVGKNEGGYLRNLAVSGSPHTIKMVLDVPHEAITASNVVFELPGNGSMEEVILVGTHYDTGMFTGAVDNNGSAALMIAWAKYFASKPKKSRNRNMIFAYHSTLDTPEKITLDQLKRAYAAHIEILENVDATPEGFLRYDNIDPTRPNTPPKVRIEVLSDTVRVGDLVLAWNDSFFYSDDKTAYHYPGVPYWAGTTWDWGDGTPLTAGGPMVNHAYNKPGIYTVTMKFTDTENAVGTATRTITVLAMP